MDKTVIDAHKDQFVGKDIMADALKSLINGNREDALNAGRKLYAKQYQTLKEIKDLENKLAKAQESLAKTTDKITKVEGGDLSALFENADKPKDNSAE